MEAIRTPFTAASMWRAWRSSDFEGKVDRVSTGLRFRDRIATPFQERSPSQTASYPWFRSACAGNAPCSALSSWRQTTSGLALASQAKRFSSLLLMSLMLNVAIFTLPPEEDLQSFLQLCRLHHTGALTRTYHPQNAALCRQITSRRPT